MKKIRMPRRKPARLPRAALVRILERVAEDHTIDWDRTGMSDEERAQRAADLLKVRMYFNLPKRAS